MLVKQVLEEKEVDKNKLFYRFKTYLFHPLHKIGFLSAPLYVEMALNLTKNVLICTVKWKFKQLRDRNDFRALELDQWVAEHYRKQIQGICAGMRLQ